MCEFIDIIKNIVLIMVGIIVIIVCVNHLVIFWEDKNRKVIIPEVIKEEEDIHPLYRHWERKNCEMVDLNNKKRNKYK